MAAENNMTITMCSTPANHFHLLRRQALSSVRRPLIAFTPKSLLRLKAAVSQLSDFTTGTFQPVIADTSATADAQRVVLCSGKLYYDLLAARAELPASRGGTGNYDVALVRVEQLYPLPVAEIAAQIAQYPQAQLIWAQEEPANQGAYPFMALNLAEQLAALGDKRPLYRASRPSSASPAVGSTKMHEAQQREVIATALGS
jgi:2-oxoglutarate dehydrogenase E1 component